MEGRSGPVFGGLDEISNGEQSFFGFCLYSGQIVDRCEIGLTHAQNIVVKAGGKCFQFLPACRSDIFFGTELDRQEQIVFPQEDKAAEAALRLAQGKIQGMTTDVTLPLLIVLRIFHIQAVGGEDTGHASIQAVSVGLPVLQDLALTLEAAVLKEIVSLPGGILCAQEIPDAGRFFKELLRAWVRGLGMELQPVLLRSLLQRVQHFLAEAVVDPGLRVHVSVFGKPVIRFFPTLDFLHKLPSGLLPGQRRLRLRGIRVPVLCHPAAADRVRRCRRCCLCCLGCLFIRALRAD